MVGWGLGLWGMAAGRGRRKDIWLRQETVTPSGSKVTGSLSPTARCALIRNRAFVGSALARDLSSVG